MTVWIAETVRVGEWTTSLRVREARALDAMYAAIAASGPRAHGLRRGRTTGGGRSACCTAVKLLLRGGGRGGVAWVGRIGHHAVGHRNRGELVRAVDAEASGSLSDVPLYLARRDR